MNMEIAGPEPLDLLRGMGPLCIQDEIATVDLDDCARLHAVSLGRR